MSDLDQWVVPTTEDHLPERKEPEQVVFLLHGIRTQAEWQEPIADALTRDSTIEAIPIRYGYLDVIRFLLPFKVSRLPPVRRTATLMRDARDQRNRGRDPARQVKLSVIAHSFGTYVFGSILEREPDLYFHRAILCGSILKAAFPWENYPHRFTAPIRRSRQVLNDCGYRDIWPVLAASATWGYGPSGRFGFGHPRVRDRFHQLAHSEFLSAEFAARYWLPFLA